MVNAGQIRLGIFDGFSEYGLTHSVLSVQHVTFPSHWPVSIEGLFLFTGRICHRAPLTASSAQSFSIRLGDFPQVR